MITFLEKPHLYLVNGVITPSVSEILHFIFPDKYKGIDARILNRKGIYGTTIHESVEMYEANIKTMALDEAFDVTVQAMDLNYIQEIIHMSIFVDVVLMEQPYIILLMTKNLKKVN